MSDREIRCICEGCHRGLELVYKGNNRAVIFTLRMAREIDQLGRLILDTGGPAGSGVQPLGIQRMANPLSSMGELPAEQAICLTTGNAAMCNLDCGIIESGCCEMQDGMR